MGVGCLPMWRGLRIVVARECCPIVRAVDTNVPLEIAERFLKRGRPVKAAKNKAWVYQYSAKGRRCVVGGAMLRDIGVYPSAFGTCMAKMAVAISKGRGL